MENKILSSGAYGCIYHPGYKCSGNTSTNQKIVTKVQRDIDSVVSNEIDISKMITSIQNYEKYFGPVIKSCKLNIAEIKDDTIQKCKTIKNQNDIILMHLRYINSEPFNDRISYLINKATSRFSKIRLLQIIIKSYVHCLEGIEILVEKEIIHFDLHGNNLLFNIDNNTPVLIDFGLSMQKNKISKFFTSRDSFIFNINPSLKQYSIEIQLLKYYLSNKISRDKINKTCIKYFVNASVLTATNEIYPTFFNEYLEIANTYFNKLFKKSKIDILTELKSYWNTWDNYCISLIFLKSLNSLILNNKINKHNIIILKIYKLLVANISPNPKNRLTISDTISKFKNILKSNNGNIADILI